MPDPTAAERSLGLLLTERYDDTRIIDSAHA